MTTTTMSHTGPARAGAPESMTARYPFYNVVSGIALVLSAVLVLLDANYLAVMPTWWTFASLLVALGASTLAVGGMFSQPKSEPLSARNGYGPKLRNVLFSHWVAVGQYGNELAPADIYGTTLDRNTVTNWRCIRPSLTYAAIVVVLASGLLLVPTGMLG